MILGAASMNEVRPFKRSWPGSSDCESASLLNLKNQDWEGKVLDSEDYFVAMYASFLSECVRKYCDHPEISRVCTLVDFVRKLGKTKPWPFVDQNELYFLRFLQQE